MRAVLLLAFHYPPIGGAGAQRAIQLAKYLPDNGYRPIVLSGPGVPDYRWTPADTSLEEGNSTRVRRLEGREPPHGIGWESRLERWLRIAPRWQRWWAAQLRLAAPSLAGEVNLVRASLAPYAIGPAVIELAHRIGVPLVLDLEDPWAIDEMMVYPTRFHRRLELGKMRRVLKRADIAVMNTTEAARRAAAAFPELAGRLRAIPNAYDPSDFDGPSPTRADRRFRIVHTGSFHMDLGERHRHVSALRSAAGGYVRGVDFLPRSHVFLVEAMERLLAARRELRGLVELHCAGVLTEAERRSLEQFDGVRLHGFLPHDQTTALMRSADLLFLPMHDLAPGRRATIVPQKTYEYLAAGRPILAAVPDGDARDLLGEAGTARLCRPSDVDDMTRIIAAEIDDWRRSSKRPQPAPELLARCAAPHLATAMAELFDELLAGRTA